MQVREWIIIVFCIIALLVRASIAGRYVRQEFQYRKDAPYVGSYPSHRQVLRTCFPRLFSEGKIVADIGCGDGGMLRFRCRELGCVQGVGYEIRTFPRLLQRVYAYVAPHRNAHIRILHKNIWDISPTEWKDYDLIYIFLFPSMVEKLEKILSEHCRSDTVIVTNTFHFPTRKPFQTLLHKNGKVVMHLYKVA